jgi:hypothetical protein
LGLSGGRFPIQTRISGCDADAVQRGCGQDCGKRCKQRHANQPHSENALVHRRNKTLEAISKRRSRQPLPCGLGSVPSEGANGTLARACLKEVLSKRQD